MSKEMAIYAGKKAKILSAEKQLKLAKSVCQLLSGHQETMLQYQPKEVLQVMKEEMVVVATDGQGELLAFARLWSYKQDNSLMEFGSWVSAKCGNGIGSKVLHQAVELGKQINPEAQIVAVVAEKNKKVFGLIQYLGGVLLDDDSWPKDLPKLLGEGETSTVAIDMTEISFEKEV